MDAETESILFNGVEQLPVSATHEHIDYSFRSAIPRFGVVLRDSLEQHLERMHRRFRVIQAAKTASSTPDPVLV